MVCSICKLPGHNRRSCNAIFEDTSKQPKFIDDEGNPTTCPCCMEEITEKNAIWCNNGHLHCSTCMFENVKTKYDETGCVTHARTTGMKCFICRDVNFKGNVNYINKKLKKHIHENENKPEMRRLRLERDAEIYASEQTYHLWYNQGTTHSIYYRRGITYLAQPFRLTQQEYEFIRQVRTETMYEEQQNNANDFVEQHYQRYMDEPVELLPGLRYDLDN